MTAESAMQHDDTLPILLVDDEKHIRIAAGQSLELGGYDVTALEDAEQALTAATWPRTDIVAIDAIVNTMIDNVVTGAAIPNESLRRAENQINQLRDQPAEEGFDESGEAPKTIEDIGFF